MIGFIPSYASGTLYRTGPGGYQIQDTPNGSFSTSHWFDGFGQTHRFELTTQESGQTRVMYNSRMQVDALMQHIKETGSFHTYTFAQKQDPCISIFGKIMTVFTPLDAATPHNLNANVTISANSPTSSSSSSKPVQCGVRSVQLKTDCLYIKDIDPETLEPVGLKMQDSLHPKLTGVLSATHSKSDPVTGDIFNFNVDCVGRYPTYRVFQVSAATGETSILATISGPGIYAAYIHSLFLSDDFVILCIWNSHLSYNGIAVLWKMNVLDAISPFDSQYPAKWLVVDRKHGKGLVAEFDSPAFFAFHTVNAYQTPSERRDGSVDVFCSIIEYPNTDIMHKFFYENIMSTSNTAASFQAKRGVTICTKLTTYALRNIKAETLNCTTRNKTIPPAEVVSEMLHVGELPMFNLSRRMRKLRYIYTVVDRGYSSLFDGLCKVDLQIRTKLYWDNPHGHTPGEAIFVANPDGVEEDDGVLLSVVLDGFEGRSYLLCLDARNMKEMGRAQCNWVVSQGFHGQHVSKDGVAVEF